ncbi:hypothetical protein BGW80DRAFT_1172752 [Lactifluus volemus]|nr:hypothetical protein BGW80DRAFT_1172752 [Lactifluus volemus]
MPPSGPPTEKEIWNIARRTTDIIESRLTSNVCVFGSAACSLWTDIQRTPNDVDIVVSNRWYGELDPEDIKDTIVEADSRYYLQRSKKRWATHRILYCRLPGWRTNNRCVKVDILVPPTLELPEIEDSERVHIKDIPVMPIFDLLVMKTKGWFDHCTSDRADFRAKEDADVNDIIALLKRAAFEGVSYDNEVYENRLSEDFMDLAVILVKAFVGDHGRRRQWRALGFPV